MKNFSRYGFVETELDGKITEFREKGFQKFGKINGGIYVIKNNIFKIYKGDEFFLFSDFIKNNLNSLNIGSISFDELFIDIGTPKDLEKAKKILINYM